MKKEQLVFVVTILLCIAGIIFGIYYGDEINKYINNNINPADKNPGDMVYAFLCYYYDSAKLQLLVFLCSFTVFSAPAGVLSTLYGSIALGSSIMVLTSEFYNSGYLLYLIVIPYALAGAISLYFFIEMVCRAYNFSITATHAKNGFGALAISRETRSYISGLLLLSAVILVSELCRFIIIVLVN